MFNLLDAQRKNNEKIKHHHQNDFWSVFLSQNIKIKDFYESNNNYEIRLSGSGSCMYLFYEKESDIKEILKKIPSNWRFFFCKPLQYSPICYIK
jgi:4-diphosphocytidyl-2-C-methyl-D-erythritol kinase